MTWLLAMMAAPTITTASLLEEMASLDHLTRPPQPVYTAAQASSYDRNARKDGDWFANGDAGQFVRTETNAGRREAVLADLRGPGAVMRIWSANPAGTVRFYFDGEERPRLEAPLLDLLTGKVAPFVMPFAYFADRGTNLYFPFPYARSLKITVQDPGPLYYQVGFRSFASGTSVQTFEPGQLPSLWPPMKAVAAALLRPRDPQTTRRAAGVLGRGQRLAISAASPTGGEVALFRVRVALPAQEGLAWTDPRAEHNVLRQLRLNVRVDGERTVDVPLGDFFGSAPGLNPYRSFPFTVREDGTMESRLPMPFRRSMAIEVRNDGGVTVPLSMEIAQRESPWGDGRYVLHAQWMSERQSTRPMKDMEFLKVEGEGYWFGSMLHIENPVPDWWGEGDEKVYVDGEAFPSTFGTGTEDYYGYAWSSPTLFQLPYHAQTRCDGPGTAGHSSINRWHVMDPIPYRRSLTFDMEMWHWKECVAGFSRIAFWYAKPGGTPPVAVNRSLLLPRTIAQSEPVRGAIEGEKMAVVGRSGGKLENQGGFPQLSSGYQLWWTEANVGETLTLKFRSPRTGRFRVAGHFCFARDYGIHTLTINGRPTRPIDFFGDLTWKVVDLGVFDLRAGDNDLIVTCQGANAAAIPGRMFGLDYLLLQKP